MTAETATTGASGTPGTPGATPGTLPPEHGGRALDRVQAEALLYREARLLDTLRLEEWLTLFTDDGLYWLPMEDGEVSAATDTISIVFDDTDRRAERVYRTLHTPVLDQKPRSRTMHLVGNVEVDGVDEHGDTRVLCNQLIGENRPGGDGQIGLNGTRVLLARCDYRVRDTADGWRISMKKMLLLNADQPIYNLTFLL
jgi:3-phenylpropionate/cinnamic acid dioxygenase small subunit